MCERVKVSEIVGFGQNGGEQVHMLWLDITSEGGSLLRYPDKFLFVFFSDGMRIMFEFLNKRDDFGEILCKV